MLAIGPLGSAACVRALAVIREAGERFTRGRLVRLLKRVAEPNGFYMRASNWRERPCSWGPRLFLCDARGE
jgi:hypothetical protein